MASDIGDVWLDRSKAHIRVEPAGHSRRIMQDGETLIHTGWRVRA